MWTATPVSRPTARASFTPPSVSPRMPLTWEVYTPPYSATTPATAINSPVVACPDGK